MMGFVVACLMTTNLLFAQDIKFGKVSGTEMKMTVYPEDSTAEAVILSDIGKFDKQTFRFYRHLRVKILKKSGTHWGNWTFPVPSKGAIRGIVYNMENGEVVKEKLDKSNIHEEEIVEDYVVYKVFMPNVKVGSVIDIKYDFVGLPFEWRFQQRIPVKYCELELEKSEYVHFSMNHFGFEPVTSITSGSHWMVKNMPSFKSEPYISDYSNYITKFEIDLKSIIVPGRIYKEYTSSWEALNDYLMDHDYVGGALNGASFLNSFAKDVKDLDLTMEEKIDTAYNYIRDNIKWNGNSSIYTTTFLRNNFVNDHMGNSAEVNLMLVNLLNKMDVRTFPVVLSTRSNGILNPVFPSLNKLNYVIAYVYQDDVRMALDATDEDLLPGMLPERCINGQGRLISKEYTTWVDLGADSRFMNQTMISINQTDDGWEAKVSRKLTGHDYLRWIDHQEDLNSEIKYKAELEESYPGIVIEDYSKEARPDETIVVEHLDCDITELVDDFGQELYVPGLIMVDSENPFKNPERKYPVDFVLPSVQQFIVNITLDEDHTIGTLPENAVLRLPENGGEIFFVCNGSGNRVNLQVRLKINKSVFTEAEYPYLQTFYSEMISKLNETIQVVKRT